MGRMGVGLNLLGRLIVAVTAIIALIIAIGILFHVLKANSDNAIVTLVYDVAGFFVGPFDEMFKLKDPRAEIAVNWGIALAVYVLVGRLLAKLVERASPEP